MPSETTAAHADYLPGAHVLIDFWGARRLDDPAAIEKALRDAAETCGATVLDIRLHQFGQNNGVTGVALLSESHISIHTWPETGYAALDVFMCGLCRAEDAVPPLKDSFLPTAMKVTVVDRGKAPPASAETIEIASRRAPTPGILRSRP